MQISKTLHPTLPPLYLVVTLAEIQATQVLSSLKATPQIGTIMALQS